MIHGIRGFVFLFMMFSVLPNKQALAAPPKNRAVKTIPSRPQSAETVTTATTDSSDAQTESQIEKPVLYHRVAHKERRVYLFGGADFGFSSISAFNALTEGSRSGLHLGFRALGAIYTNDWVFDLGLGWQFLSNSGDNPDGSTSKVITRGSYIDFSPRYRMGDHWQLGPIFDLWLTTDNGLNPNIKSSASNTAFLGGLTALYEWDDESWKYRVGGRWLTDLNISDRTVHQFQLVFQMGFPIFGDTFDRYVDEEYKPKEYTEELSERDINDAVKPEPTEPVVVAAEPTPTPEPAATPADESNEDWTNATGPKEKFVITLDLSKIPFDYDRATLPRYHADRIREVGRFLGEHSDKWRSLVVKGHTDNRGKDAYNLQLSLARSRTVKQLLLEGGAPADRVKAEGWGERRPIDKRENQEAWAKNRRVEFEFRGVTDALIIRQGFQAKD